MTNSDSPTPTRRGLLRRIGVGAGVGASLLAGCGQRPGPTGTETPPGTSQDATPGASTGTPGGFTDERSDYGTVIDMVDEGADPAGGDPIDDVLPGGDLDDTLLFFPEGEYLLDGGWQLREFEHFGVLGDGAVVRPRDGYSGYLFAFGWSDRAVDFLFKGIDFDITAPETGVRPVHATIQDGLHVADVTVRGLQDTDQDSFRFDVTLASGTGLVENLNQPDGGDARYPITGCYVGEVTDGTLTFKDCNIAGFPDNGLYASQANGPVHVVGGRYENNNVSNVRVTSDAVVRGVTVRSTEAREGFSNVRGIRMRSGRNVLVEDCTLEYTDVVGSNGAITMHDWLESATVRNTTVKIDTDDVPAIQAKAPANEVGSPGSGIRIENVRITGRAANRSAIEIDERSGTVLSDLCIHQTGGGRNGIRLLRSNDNVIRNCAIQVTGEPILLQDSTASRENVRTGRVSGGTGSMECLDEA